MVGSAELGERVCSVAKDHIIARRRRRGEGDEGRVEGARRARGSNESEG